MVRPSKPVLITGSGLSGLTLAQALKRHGIPFRIFERDAASDHRAQGYRIRINDFGLEALRKCLPENVYARFEETTAQNSPMGGKPLIGGGLQSLANLAVSSRPNAGPGSVGTPNTGASSVASPRGQPPQRGPGYYSLPADRNVMRSVLLSGLEDSISYGKAFSDYTISPDGIIVHFSDGTSSPEGSLVVGADGVHSKVSRKLTGDLLLPKQLETWMIFGKTFITPELMESLSPELTGGMELTRHPSETSSQALLFTEPMRFRHTDAPSDYIYWVMLSDERKFGLTDEQLSGLNSQAAADVAVRVAKDWLPDIRPVIEQQDSKNTSALRMTTSDPNGVPSWSTLDRVTLIGDAIHCMPPTGGSGANTALRDAALLSEKLRTGMSSGGWSKEVIKDFEQGMLEYASEWVTKSYKAATTAFGVKPLES